MPSVRRQVKRYHNTADIKTLPIEEAQATAVDASLGRDPAMRWIVGSKAIERQAASTSQMGRFETDLLASNENFAALTDNSGVWIDRMHDRPPPKLIILDMDSSVSPTHGE